MGNISAVQSRLLSEKEYTCRVSGSAKIDLFGLIPSRLFNSVFGFLPKCISNADFFNRVCGVIRITSNANSILSFKDLLSSRFVSIISFSVRTPLSTSPVGVCIYGVPYISFMPFSLQKFRKIFPVNAVPLSVRMVLGYPCTNIYCFINSVTVDPSVVLVILADGHLLYRSTESNMYILQCLNVTGPKKSN